MKKPNGEFSVKSHFQNKDKVVREIYERLLRKVGQCGTVSEDPKKTSIHLVNRTAFAGVATRKSAISLTIKSDHALASSRVTKSEQVSAHRFHHEVKLTSPADIDSELIGWLIEAYELSA